MKSKSTLQAVAKLANVSPATVSRLVNRTTPVSAEVECRIREAASRLGFDLNRKRSSRLIAFLLGNRSLLHPFHSQVLLAAEAYCASQDYNLLFFPLHYSASQHWTKLHVPRVLYRPDMIDGFIVSGVNYQNVLDLLTDIGLPFAVLGDTVQGEWKSGEYDSVCVDDRNGAYELTRYLQNLGHTRIAFVANNRLAWFQRRCESYLRAMKEADLDPLIAEIDSDHEYEAGYLAMKQILAQRPRPVDAVFGGSDAICHGIYAALREAGLTVPEEISVCGFNDTPEATVLYPPLTSVRVFPELIGRQLAEMVLARIANPGGPTQQRVIPTQLVKRESCLAVSRLINADSRR
jgi:DNA-binding LacI/PurR family transcriptional regulator